MVVYSVYKPPTERFVLPALGHINLPHIVIGDFNSHSTTWGYTITDNKGAAVEHWEEANNITFIHDAKLPKSFNSKRWKSGYNPDLIFASTHVRRKYWTLFHIHNTNRSVLVQIQWLWHNLQFSEDSST